MTDPIILNYASPGLTRWRGEYAAWWWARICYALGGIVVPGVCWGASFSSLAPKAEWQSGHLAAYTAFLLHGRVAYPFFPFLLYSMLCLGLLLIRREFFARALWIRLGIYSALPQALLFMLILAAGSNDSGPGELLLALLLLSGIAVVASGPAIGFWWLTRGLGWRVPQIVGLVGAGIFALSSVVAAVSMHSPIGLVQPLMLMGLLALVAGPATTLVTFGVMTFYLVGHRREYQMRPVVASLFWPLWAAGYGGAAAAATVRALEEYAKLPKTPPPSCYIATAAARGHRRLVGSVPWPGEPAVRVNDQLRTLKAFEILLQTLTPRLHRHLRRLYNAVAPPLAARLTHPLLADLAFLSLKPLEWAARGALEVMGLRVLARRLYR